jgi:hypothetical protein
MAPVRFEILAGAIEALFGSSGEAAPDLDGPEAMAGNFANEVDPGSGSAPVETRPGALESNLKKIFNHHAFPQQFSHRVPGKLVECADTEH